ncbi:cell division protein ZapD [Psychromonas marina]|uniref:Cell division protein ZapD n=1 Tax=Psychromonas marina TaxID=88364 RepID=A0ABQ6DYA4_9GAMM|nr:cell division protein ZapD [Psychromonas marina]GLS89848.1 cell division protein ZapD [Psychromonas marina]
MTNMITFEYPLNEKMRSYLRFEFLFLQIVKSKKFNHESDTTVFFKALFELLELSERCDIRHDLIKDLRLLSTQMKLWLNHDQVDHEAVSQLLLEIDELITAVLLMPKQLRYFKTNRFLTSLKQRFSIPSGCCNFDLPQYHFWLAEGQEKQQKDAAIWLTHFDALQKALILYLKIKRSQGVVSKQTAVNGFFQGEVENSCFVSIEFEKSLAVYPMISGHKDRYSVRFMSSDIEHHLAENIEFKQICC